VPHRTVASVQSRPRASCAGRGRIVCAHRDLSHDFLKSHIKPKWGGYPLQEMKPLSVEQWLKGLDLAPKSKGHLKNQMRMVFNCAMRWELVHYQTNPIGLVRAKDVSKRMRQPTTLTIENSTEFSSTFQNPTERRVLWQGALGCESARLSDCSGATSTGRSTSCRFAILGYAVASTNPRRRTQDDRYRWISHSRKCCGTTVVVSLNRSKRVNGSSPANVPGCLGMLGRRRQWLVRAGQKAGIESLAWHAFRHTYSTLLNEYRPDAKVQQELLRHADIGTTMNIYTTAVPERLRKANRKVVRLLLPTGT
jgi:integrase